MIREMHWQKETLPGQRVLHRIEALTLGFGVVAGACAAVMRRPDWAEGLLGGAVLGWLNFRWLARGIRAMIQAAVVQAETQLVSAESVGNQSSEGSSSSALTAGTYLTLLFRYALVAVGVYVIFNYLHVPLVSIGLGLCALVAAIMATSVWEIVSSEN